MYIFLNIYHSRFCLWNNRWAAIVSIREWNLNKLLVCKQFQAYHIEIEKINNSINWIDKPKSLYIMHIQWTFNVIINPVFHSLEIRIAIAWNSNLYLWYNFNIYSQHNIQVYWVLNSIEITHQSLNKINVI